MFRNTAKTAHWYWLFVWGICSVFVVLGFYPPLGGYHDTGDSWGSNMEGDCGYAAWENWYSPWVIGLQILPYALVFVLSINTLRKAKTYLTAGCRRTRYAVCCSGASLSCSRRVDPAFFAWRCLPRHCTRCISTCHCTPCARHLLGGPSH